MYDARPERGTKRICTSCDARFCDLARTPILCPKCGTEYIEPVRPPPIPRSSRRGWPAKGRAEPASETEAADQPAAAEEALFDDGEHEPGEEEQDQEEGSAEGETAD